MAAKAKADAPVPARVSLTALASAEKIGRAERVYADAEISGVAVPRTLTQDGRMATVQREVRVGGKFGPLQAALIKVNADGTESVTRMDLSAVGQWRRAMDSAGFDI